MKKNKAYYEKQFVEELIKVGVNQYCETDERGNTYYCFWLKDGVQRYWTNMSKENLNNIIKSTKGAGTMNIMLGNLSLEEIEKRAGIEFPKKLKELLKNTREQNCNNVKGRRVWHCYDMPFSLIVGQMDFAKEIYEELKPLSSQFKQQMQIGIYN